MRRLMLVGVVVMGLSGCMTADKGVADYLRYLPETATPEYRKGYEDGCHTGMHERCIYTQDTREVRDEARMRSDVEYSLGWQDGARKCGMACAAAYGGSPMIIRTK
jgi:hypothetical protein